MNPEVYSFSRLVGPFFQIAKEDAEIEYNTALNDSQDRYFIRGISDVLRAAITYLLDKGHIMPGAAEKMYGIA